MKRRSQSVFVGRVTALRALSDGDLIATLQVSRVWKDSPPQMLEMSMVETWTCTIGVPALVKVGAERIVFAGTTGISRHPLHEGDLVDTELGRQRLEKLGRGRALEKN